MKNIGIDVSKRFHYASLSSGGKPFVFSNSLNGFEALLKWATEDGSENLVFGLEPTGRYSQLLCEWLHEKGHTVRVISGLTVNRAKHVLSNSRNKTDAHDSLIIAKCTEEKLGGLYEPKVDHFRTLSSIISSREWAIKQRTQHLNRLHNCLTIAFPELVQLKVSRLKSDWVLELLQTYPSARLIAELKQSAFDRSWPRAKRTPVIEMAKESIGQSNWVLENEIQRLTKSIMNWNVEINELDKALLEGIEMLNYGRNLLTIPHLGFVSLGKLLSLTGDLTQYPTNKHLLSYAGLNLIEASSGRKKSPVHISREGNSALRAILYYCSISMARPISVFYPWYLTRRERNIPNKKIFVAGSRRLLRIAHAVARNNTPFVLEAAVV